MKGSECKLIEYMDGAKKRFVIPVYQRNYDWKTENCKQLYDDLVKVIRNHRKSHFFGSLVSVYNPEGRYTEFMVIDGQQRLTTVSLLFLAMYNIMENKILTADTASLQQQIYEDYLVDKWQPAETRIKLKPVKNDQEAFKRLFSEETEHVKGSNLTNNYEYFYNRIQREELTLDELYDAIGALEIINITLNQDDNPQLIFESLNSTGLALSEGDKIRNFILMGLPTTLQNKYYEDYWNKIELCTAYNVSAFVRDYLSVKRQEIPALDKVYITFKNYVEETGMNTQALLIDMLAYAKWYEILLRGKTADKALNACIYRMNRLETTITRPFFLEALRLQSEGILSLADVKDVFLFSENYLFRRNICDLPTNALNKIFLMLHKEIMRYDGTTDRYVEKFKYALISKSDRGRFPDDTEFADAFSTRPIYLMNSKNKIYILERLENYGTIEDKDVYRHFDDGDYSIEHIMPQHLTPAWTRALGPEYEQIHEIWLHRIANLTLTGYNSKYSNSPFIEKRDITNGFRESGLRMNMWIAQREDWTLHELEERSDMLVSRALKIWAMPATDFKPAEKQMESYTLDDDVNLSGRVIARFGYRNTEQPVGSWIDMFEQVMRILHAEDKSVLTMLAYSSDGENELSQYVSNRPEKLRGALQIDQDIYVERNTSTWTKLSMLRKFFKAYSANPEDLVFYLRDSDDNHSEEEAGTRYELRRRYWKYALPVIQAAHGEGNSFSNVTTSKQNWISGFVGINGVSINCIANVDMARVELYFGSANKDRNKVRFDKLFLHKSEIDARFGDSVLVWNRSDETKSSSVYCVLKDVSIQTEADWAMMARFHAEVSKKMYDVMLPYIQEY